METISAPAPRRLIRRLIPWTLASGLFAGGGFGVYQVALPVASVASNGTAAENDPFGSSSSSAANEQIKQLFAAKADAPPNRYAAAELPGIAAATVDGVATPRNAAEVTGAQNPFAITSPLDGSNSALQSAEVTRGQEPGPNPLRPAPAAAMVEDQPVSATAAADEPTLAPPPAMTNPFATANRYAAPAPEAAATAATASAAAANAAAAFGSEPTAAMGPTAAGEPTPASPSQAESSIPAGFQPSSFAPSESASPPVADAEPTPADPPASPFAAAAPLEVASRPMSPSFANEVMQSAAPSADANRLRGVSGADDEFAVTPTPGLAAADGAGQPGGRELEGLQSPAITLQKQTPAEIQVGTPCTFFVRVFNSSKHAVQGVQIRDEIPLGTQLIGTTPRAQVAGSQVLWEMGELGPGEERIVEMKLMPTTEGELGSVATVSFAAQASAKVRCTKPELALRLSAQPQVMIGDQQLVKIEVSNTGSGDAAGVMLLANIPPGVAHEAGPALEFEVGTLKAGESRPLDLVLTAEQAGRVNNVMVARSAGNLEVQAACEFEVIAPALKVSIDGPSMRYLDRPATYTVSIENPGTAAAKEVLLTTQLPPGLKFKNADNYGEYDAATHSVHWSLAELPASGTANGERGGSVQLTVLPVEPGQHKVQVATRAEQGLEDRTEASLTVEGLVALSFEVKAADGAVEIGGETTYEVTVVNQGTKAAANVQVQVAMPDGLRAVQGEGSSQAVVQPKLLAFAPLPQLAPQAEAKFRIKVQGLRPGDQRARIMVTADDVTDPITKEQSTRVYADQ